MLFPPGAGNTYLNRNGNGFDKVLSRRNHVAPHNFHDLFYLIVNTFDDNFVMNQIDDFGIILCKIFREILGWPF